MNARRKWTRRLLLIGLAAVAVGAGLAARARLRLRRPPGRGRARADLPGGLAEALADAPARPRLPHQDRGRPGPPARPRTPRSRKRPWPANSACVGLHVPIVDIRGTNDRRAISDQLEIAAAAVADPRNQPVYFHCHHGINRASMVQMAYRMLYCGWTLDQASDEIDRDFGLVEVSRGPDYRHMEEFYRERVLPRRLVSESKAAPRPPDRQAFAGEVTPGLDSEAGRL